MNPSDLAQLQFWHWWAAGLVLLVLETFAPGAVFLWMGVSAFVTGALLWMLGIGWEAQLVIFGVLSIVSLLAFRRFRPRSRSTDAPTLNRRGDSYVGRDFTLDEPIVNGIGKLRVDDSQWRISGLDVPAGARVRVTRADGVTLHVERLD